MFKYFIRRSLIFLDYLFWVLFDLSKFKKVKKNKIKKILVIHLGAIGELLVTTPAIKALKTEIAGEIDFMVTKSYLEVLDGNPAIRKIIPFSSFKNNLKYLRSQGYDLAVIFWPAKLTITLCCLLAGIKYRIGCFKMVKEGPAFFLTRRWWPFKISRQHAVQSNLDIIRLIGVDNLEPKIEVFFREKDSINVDKLLHEKKIKRFAIIHPGFGGKDKHKSYSRNWPKKIYSSIADKLKKEYGLAVIISGIGEEREFAEEIKKGSVSRKYIHITSGDLSIKEFFALVYRAEIVIAPDTSIIHVASSFNKKIIDLIGSDPIEWAPLTEKENYRIIKHPYLDNKHFIFSEDLIKSKLQEITEAIGTLLK